MYELYRGNCLDILDDPLFLPVRLVIGDLPYSTFPLINNIIRASRAKCCGASLFFMYPDDLFHLHQQPDQVLHWVKPISTKNTAKRYSRFVEAIAVYDLDKGPFNQDIQWANRSGIFTDQLMHKPRHPHEKPQSLIERLILTHSNPGDSVLDPTCGSGTLLRACLNTGRFGFGIEISDTYYQLARSEIQAYATRWAGVEVAL